MKIPIVKQQYTKDCGPCSLQSIIKYYGGYVPLEKIRQDAYTSSKGTSIYHLLMAARDYGFDAIAKNNPQGIYSFYGNGQLKEINNKNIKVEFLENGSQFIKEYLNNNITKTTFYHEDGRISVNYKNGDMTKVLNISSENTPIYYSICEGGKCVRSATFSNEGYLQWAE